LFLTHKGNISFDLTVAPLCYNLKAFRPKKTRNQQMSFKNKWMPKFRTVFQLSLIFERLAEKR